MPYRVLEIQGLFAKFMDSSYYSVSELCGGAVFFKVPPLASNALLTTLHSLLENRVMVVLKEPFFRMAEQP
jgi:hypothetical protein